jgi:hypothetical protein
MLKMAKSQRRENLRKSDRILVWCPVLTEVRIHPSRLSMVNNMNPTTILYTSERPSSLTLFSVTFTMPSQASGYVYMFVVCTKTTSRRHLTSLYKVTRQHTL